MQLRIILTALFLFFPAAFSDSSKITIDLVHIPHGSFTMGSDTLADAFPSREVFLDSYYISRTEISNTQYLCFLKDTGAPAPRHFSKRDSDKSFFNTIPLRKEIENLPAVNITYNEALCFCAWLSGKTKKFFCLPTEAQWEKAARGTDARTYPWGNSQFHAEETKAVFNRRWIGFRTLAPVQSFENGKSFSGCYHMAGNAAEWCLESYNPFYPRSSITVNPVDVYTESANKILRGGSHNSAHFKDLAVYTRKESLKNGPALETIGFRVVLIEKSNRSCDVIQNYFEKELFSIEDVRFKKALEYYLQFQKQELKIPASK